MKRAWSYIVFFSTLVLLVSAYSERVIKADEGYTAPEIEMIHNDSVNISLANLRGKYVLVNFWDSSNAISRIATGEYDRFLRRGNTNHPFALLSVNTDSDPNMFHEIIKKDSLEGSTQFHITDIKTKNMKSDYRLDHGFSSYLINPEGKIIAINPSVETLEKYLTGR